VAVGETQFDRFILCDLLGCGRFVRDLAQREVKTIVQVTMQKTVVRRDGDSFDTPPANQSPVQLSAGKPALRLIPQPRHDESGQSERLARRRGRDVRRPRVSEGLASGDSTTSDEHPRNTLLGSECAAKDPRGPRIAFPHRRIPRSPRGLTRCLPWGSSLEPEPCTAAARDDLLTEIP
jgi:hypothetical protein